MGFGLAGRIWVETCIVVCCSREFRILLFWRVGVYTRRRGSLRFLFFRVAGGVTGYFSFCFLFYVLSGIYIFMFWFCF